MSSQRLSVSRLLPGVRPKEQGRALFFTSLLGLISLAQTLGLVGAEALFLTRVGVKALPQTFVLAAAVTVGGSLIYALWVDRIRNDSYFIRLLCLFVLVLSAVVLADGLEHRWGLVGLFCLFFLTQAIFLNHFWTFAGDYFDAHVSKRLFPLFTIGNSLGALVGGGVAVAVGRFLSPEALVLAWTLGLCSAALLLRLGHRRLRRWGPLELEEADETSVSGLREATRYIRRSRFGQWLTASSAGMVLALFVAQYVYSDIFVRSFGTVERLAIFLGVYLAAANLIEIGVEVWITPRLIRRFGVASANIVHPLVTILSFLVLIFDYRLAAAIFARMNRELVEDAVAAPMRTLVYNALPFRFRGRIRAFLEGIVFYGGMALAGGLLIGLRGRLEPLPLCLAGLVTSGLYLIASLRVRREYLRSLADELRAGRLDLGEIRNEIGSRETQRLASLWTDFLDDPSQRLSSAQLELPSVLVGHGIIDPVRRGLRHGDPRIRLACVEALREVDPAAIRAALDDPDASVRLAVLGALADDTLTAALDQLLCDPAAEVRAEAALRAGEAGLSTLRKMARSPETETAVAALRRLPASLADLAQERASATEPMVRAQAMETSVRLLRRSPFGFDRLSTDLRSPDVRVRRAAVVALAELTDPQVLPALAGSLKDPAASVRELASTSLAAAGEPGIRVVLPFLEAVSVQAVEAALQTVARSERKTARAILASALQRRVREAWSSLLALRVLQRADEPSLRFLCAAYENGVSRNLKLAFLILELAEDAQVMRTVAKVLRSAPSRARGSALEVLSNLGDRETARLLVLLLEPGSVNEKVASVVGAISVPKTLAEVLDASRRSKDIWIRKGYSAHSAESRGMPAGEEDMERLLHLRRVPLFSALNLDQLDAINQVLSEERYLEGEVICREGEIGSDLYVLFDGEVQVFRNYDSESPIELGTQAPVTCFGEMAILADQPRSATVVASKDSGLLTLNGERLKELILQMPEISFDFFRVLVARLRLADQRLEDLLRSRDGLQS